MMQRVVFKGEFSDAFSEGMMSIIEMLKQKLSQDFDISLNSDIKKGDLLNIHSSGFSPAFSKIPTCKASIYSLYSNVGSNPIFEMRDLLQEVLYVVGPDYSYYSNFEIARKFLFRYISLTSPVLLKRALLKRYTCVVVANDWMKRTLNLPNVVVIPPGVDIDKFSPRKRKINRRVKVAFFGHASVSKGIFETIEGFSKLKDVETHIHLTSIPGKIRTLIASKHPHINIHGKSKDIVADYNKYDIIVAPYRNQTSAISNPLVLVESMACGIPIITTDLEVMREICGQSALYVPPNSPKDIFRAIRYLSDSPDVRRKMSLQARRRVETTYSAERMVSSYKSLYKSLAT